MAQKPSIPKGTRDFNPEQVAKRNYIVNTIKSSFERFGFQPIETPSFENSSTLMGKYGEEGDRLIFKILNSGDYVKNIRNEIDEYSLFISLVGNVMESLCAKIDIDFGKEIERDVLEDELKLINRIKNYTSIRNIYKSNISRFQKILTDRLGNNSALRILLVFHGFEEEIISQVLLAILNKKEENESHYRGISDETTFVYNIDKVFLTELYKEIFKETFSSKLLSEKISEKALRYDLTVPFARYVVQHQNDIVFPFKRYQIQPVWRADRPQKGRFREFYQCDADVVGSTSLWQEVEFVQLYDEVFTNLGLKGTTIKINNRKILSGIAEVIGAQDKLIDFTVALDKLDKIGEEKVKDEMRSKGISEEGITKLQPLFTLQGDFGNQVKSLKAILSTSEVGLKGIEELEFIDNAIATLGLKSANLQLDVTLARGLNYYTGAIFEVSAPQGVQMGSIGGGGRYDDLTGIFGLKDVSGVGISFGLDRIYLVLEELNLFPETVSNKVDVLFINFGDTEALFGLKAIKALREHGVNAELYPDAAKMKKQMTYANRRAIPFVVLVGEEELANNQYTLKNMESGEQEKCSLEVLINKVK